MNTTKIAALYADPIFNTLLRFPAYDTTTTLTKQAMEHVLREARVVSEDGRSYILEASHVHRRERHAHDSGYKTRNFLEEQTTKRAADWMRNQLPGGPALEVMHLRRGMPEQDTVLISVFGCGQPDEDIESMGYLRFGAQEDLELVLRGMASIRRKRRKLAKKLEAQLRAYHAQQELAKLQKGQWLGAEKALTTAARVDEPGIQFLGDAALTPEQRQQLAYWAVPADAHMSSHFPAGTGIALKQVHRSRELVEGAVYLYQCDWNATDRTMLLGRAKLAGRSRGSLTLHCDDRPSALSMPLEWSNAALKAFRVTHYTTRNGAAPAQMVASTTIAITEQPQQVQELAHAA